MVYVIGAVTGTDELNRPAFEQVREKAEKDHPGEVVMIPHDRIPSDATWQDAMRKSIHLLTEADKVYVVQQPELLSISRGYQLESLVVKALNMPRTSVEVPND